MTPPFHHRLRNYLSGTAAVLRDEQDVASIFPNATDIGQTKENIIANILKMHIPSSCNVFLGGFIFSIQGEESGQIDVIVTDAQSLNYKLPSRYGNGKSFSCVDGTIAVVSAKSNLNANELKDALKNIASIPQGSQLTKENITTGFDVGDLQDSPLKIIYGSKGIKINNMARVLHEFYVENPSIPLNRRPNYIHVQGEYCWVRAIRPLIDDHGTVVNTGTFAPYVRNADLFFLASIIASVEKISRVLRHVIYDYTPVFDFALRVDPEQSKNSRSVKTQRRN